MAWFLVLEMHRVLASMELEPYCVIRPTLFDRNAQARNSQNMDSSKAVRLWTESVIACHFGVPPKPQLLVALISHGKMGKSAIRLYRMALFPKKLHLCMGKDEVSQN